MLQTLTQHYDIGIGTSHQQQQQKDVIGVLTTHPYTLCALLRVFARGIETLPSRADYSTNPTGDGHTPLPLEVCGPLMESSPVNYVRDAVPCPGTLSANTRFYVDHAEPDAALRSVVSGKNKLLRGGWEWPFGELGEGCEYLCVLEYARDEGGAVRPRILGGGGFFKGMYTRERAGAARPARRATPADDDFVCSG